MGPNNGTQEASSSVISFCHGKDESKSKSMYYVAYRESMVVLFK
jgi:hypothetical protein